MEECSTILVVIRLFALAVQEMSDSSMSPNTASSSISTPMFSGKTKSSKKISASFWRSSASETDHLGCSIAFKGSS